VSSPKLSRSTFYEWSAGNVQITVFDNTVEPAVLRWFLS